MAQQYEYKVVWVSKLEEAFKEGWEPVPHVPLLPHGSNYKIVVRKQLAAETE
jgi:hypothetical protein